MFSSLLQIRQNSSVRINPFPRINAFWQLLKTLLHRWNCSWWAVSPFATMFSTLFSNYTYIYRTFSCFCLVVFKVVCCTFAACVDGLLYYLHTSTCRVIFGRYLQSTDFLNIKSTKLLNIILVAEVVWDWRRKYCHDSKCFRWLHDSDWF